MIGRASPVRPAGHPEGEARISITKHGQACSSGCNNSVGSGGAFGIMPN